MKPLNLSPRQERSIRAKLEQAGYTNPEAILKTAHRVYAGLDRTERDGISFFDGKPDDRMFSILLFVDKGDGDYRHYSTRASWQWPSPILGSGINMVVEEYHAEKGVIPDIQGIKDQLMIQVARQNSADQAMITEPLKSAFARLDIPGSTNLVSSGAWKEGFLFLDGVRIMRMPGTETEIPLQLHIISQLSSTDGSPPLIVQVSVTVDPIGGQIGVDASKQLDKLRYHYGHGPIPDVEQIERDVQRLLTKHMENLSVPNQKALEVSQKQLPRNNKPHRPRH